MKSRPGIFVTLIFSFVIVAGGLGYGIFHFSQQAQPEVAQQTREYEERKMREDKAASSVKETESASPAQPETLELAPEPVAQGDDQTNLPPQDSVQVFFSKSPESLKDSSKVFAVFRPTNDQPVGAAAISYLISGPTAEEKSEGYLGGLKLRGESNCSGKDFVLRLSDARASLQFCRKYEASDKLALSHLTAQLKATLAELTNAENITVFDQNNNCLFTTAERSICNP